MCSSFCQEKFIAELFRIIQSGDVDMCLKFVKINFPATHNWCCLRHDKSGDTVSIIAAAHGQLSILALCNDSDLESSNKDGKRPLHAAAQSSHVECVRYLLSRHVSVDCLKRADWTPLMLACTKDSIDVIRELVLHGANTQLCNKDGWNVLHLAAREGSADIITFLLDTEPELWNTVSHNGRTPLHTASLHGRTDAVRVLLLRGLYQPDEQDCCGTTPLMDALRSGFVDIAKILIQQHRADVNLHDSMGRHALHLAAEAGSVAAVQFLVTDIGVNVNLQAVLAHDTALHFAAKEGHTSMTAELLALGADASLQNKSGRSALDVAMYAHRKDCVALLQSST